MPKIDVTVTCPVFDSFRVQQVAGMFDVPLAERATETFHLDIPHLADDWRIGLIVGPSGSGKSTIAENMFGGRLYRPTDWPRDRAVVDAVGDRPIKQITSLFTTVGFSSPPSWIKPYQVLSGGEQFRCDLARALLTNSEPPTTNDQQAEDDPTGGDLQAGANVVAFDEFTSVVDRNVARIASAAIAKGIRAGRIGCRFVAVTCHYDVTEWLQPDWVIDMATGSLTRRCLRRPSIKLEVFRAKYCAWGMFARHHYLSGSLSRMARCYVAIWDGTPVAFCATVTLIGAKNRWRISRIVTLPDYQGVGIGMSLTETVAQLHRDQGHRVNVTASHPALIAHCRKSLHWRAVNVRKTGSRSARSFIPNYRGSAGRAVVSFEYLGRAENH